MQPASAQERSTLPGHRTVLSLVWACYFFVQADYFSPCCTNK